MCVKKEKAVHHTIQKADHYTGDQMKRVLKLPLTLVVHC